MLPALPGADALGTVGGGGGKVQEGGVGGDKQEGRQRCECTCVGRVRGAWCICGKESGQPCDM
jgi:hypothetical protein